eukprot:CAMPEP_0118947860 /NCGR_PEP_ID=MMETSP1169-20130426/46776_1 /TAXON_ID=36882 /ORGANISM="Pyramimonas obovata, Strain CCMP722" /LENGTH=48 /DNA_ID= /DNA_START= /DNA_END= /DNA_ORIENTATION=
MLFGQRYVLLSLAEHGPQRGNKAGGYAAAAVSALQPQHPLEQDGPANG